MPDTEKEALCARIDELCAEVEALKREKPRTMLSVTAWHVAELQAENAKLRNDLEEANNQAEEVCIENAKLRELLSESLMDYKLYAEKYGLPPYISDVNEHLDARMRELGIEVDE